TAQLATENLNSLSQEKLNKIYFRDISPLVAEYNQRNLKAADRAIKFINLSFDIYRTRAREFASNITSFSTQFGTIGRFVADKWDYWIYGEQNINRIARYTRQMFARDVLSKNELRHIV